MAVFNNVLEGAIERARFDPFRIYDLCHTFITRGLSQAGADLITGAALLCHSRVQMVMRYANVIDQHQFVAIKAIEARRLRQGGQGGTSTGIGILSKGLLHNGRVLPH